MFSYFYRTTFIFFIKKFIFVTLVGSNPKIILKF